MLEEPSILREVIPPPKKLPSARVQSAVASVQAAISQVGSIYFALQYKTLCVRTGNNRLIMLILLLVQLVLQRETYSYYHY
eukprot:scaffold216588_cov47-Prasinocladus_malaysianus.AAC.3